MLHSGGLQTYSEISDQASYYTRQIKHPSLFITDDTDKEANIVDKVTYFQINLLLLEIQKWL